MKPSSVETPFLSTDEKRGADFEEHVTLRLQSSRSSWLRRNFSAILFHSIMTLTYILVTVVLIRDRKCYGNPLLFSEKIRPCIGNLIH